MTKALPVALGLTVLLWLMVGQMASGYTKVTTNRRAFYEIVKDDRIEIYAYTLTLTPESEMLFVDPTKDFYLYVAGTLTLSGDITFHVPSPSRQVHIHAREILVPLSNNNNVTLDQVDQACQLGGSHQKECCISVATIDVTGNPGSPSYAPGQKRDRRIIMGTSHDYNSMVETTEAETRWRNDWIRRQWEKYEKDREEAALYERTHPGKCFGRLWDEVATTPRDYCLPSEGPSVLVSGSPGAMGDTQKLSWESPHQQFQEYYDQSVLRDIDRNDVLPKGKPEDIGGWIINKIKTTAPSATLPLSQAQAGGGGIQGGTIKVYTTNIVGGCLRLTSRGGRGGNGQDGRSGKPGGVGSQGPCACHDTNPTGSPGGPGEDAQKGGYGGQGGDGGIVQAFVIRGIPGRLNQTLHRILMDVAAGQPGTSGQPGKPGPGGLGGPGGPADCYNAGHFYDHHWRCHPSPLGPTGPSGPPGRSAPPTPSSPSGHLGSSLSTSILLEDYTKIMSYAQFTLIQNMAADAYRKGEWKTATEQYIFLYNLTKPFLPVLPGTSPNGHVSPGSRVDRGLVDEKKGASSSPLYANLAKQAEIRLRQLSAGLDYWGHKWNYVPMLTFQSLLSQLNQVIFPTLRDLESDYEKYMNDASTMQQKEEAIEGTIDKNKITINTLEKGIQTDVEVLASVNKELPQLWLMQKHAEWGASAAGGACRTAVNDYLTEKEYALTFDKVLKIAGAVVQIAEGVMTGFQNIQSLTGVFRDLFQNGDFLKNLGVYIKDFRVFVDNVTKVEDQVAKAYKTIEQQLQGDPSEQAAKIAMREQDFDGMIEKWLFLPECYEFRTAFHHYFNASQAANDKVVDHDAAVIRIYQRQQQIRSLEDQNDVLRGKMVVGYDPTLIEFEQAVSDTYYTIKDEAVGILKFLQQAYNYEFLISIPFQYNDVRVSMLEGMATNLDIQRVKMLSETDLQRQVFSSPWFRSGSALAIMSESAMKKHKEAILRQTFSTSMVILERDQWLESFTRLDRGESLEFCLSASEPMFESFTFVRMRGVQVYLPPDDLSPGTELPEGELVRIRLTRHGFSKMYNQQGTLFTFTHAPKTMLFEYDPRSLLPFTMPLDDDTDGGAAMGLGGQAQGEGEVPKFVPLSPLGPWSLEIPMHLNPHIDTSGVKRIYLYFKIDFIPCPQGGCPSYFTFLPHNLTVATTVSEEHQANITLRATVQENATQSYQASRTAEYTAHKNMRAWYGDTNQTVTIERNASKAVSVTETATAECSDSAAITRNRTQTFTKQLRPLWVATRTLNDHQDMTLLQTGLSDLEKSSRKELVAELQQEAEAEASALALSRAQRCASKEARQLSQAKALAQAVSLAQEEAYKAAWIEAKGEAVRLVNERTASEMEDKRKGASVKIVVGVLGSFVGLGLLIGSLVYYFNSKKASRTVDGNSEEMRLLHM